MFISIYANRHEKNEVTINDAFAYYILNTDEIVKVWAFHKRDNNVQIHTRDGSRYWAKADLEDLERVLNAAVFERRVELEEDL